MGYTNEVGVYVYDETDVSTNASQLHNKQGTAVTAALKAIVVRENKSLAVPASKSAVEISVTYPKSFTDTPALIITPMSTLGVMDGLTWRIKSRTRTGFTLEAYAATARTFAFDYSAIGV